MSKRVRFGKPPARGRGLAVVADNVGEKMQKRRGEKKVRNKTEWDSTTSDLNVHKLSKTEVEKRHHSIRSRNAEEARHELYRKGKGNSFLDSSGNLRPPLSAANGQPPGKSLAALHRALQGKELHQVLAESDRTLAVMRDIFGDDPKRYTGAPNVTVAPHIVTDKKSLERTILESHPHGPPPTALSSPGGIRDDSVLELAPRKPALNERSSLSPELDLDEAGETDADSTLTPSRPAEPTPFSMRRFPWRLQQHGEEENKSQSVGGGFKSVVDSSSDGFSSRLDYQRFQKLIEAEELKSASSGSAQTSGTDKVADSAGATCTSARDQWRGEIEGGGVEEGEGGVCDDHGSLAGLSDLSSIPRDERTASLEGGHSIVSDASSFVPPLLPDSHLPHPPGGHFDSRPGLQESAPSQGVAARPHPLHVTQKAPTRQRPVSGERGGDWGEGQERGGVAVLAPSGKEASLRGQTDDLQLLEKLVADLESELADYEESTDFTSPAADKQRPSQAGTFSGITSSLLASVTKLTKYLRQSEVQLRGEVAVRGQLLHTMSEQQNLMDALTSDMVRLREENTFLRREIAELKTFSGEEIEAMKSELNGVCKQLTALAKRQQQQNGTQTSVPLTPHNAIPHSTNSAASSLANASPTPQTTYKGGVVPEVTLAFPWETSAPVRLGHEPRLGAEGLHIPSRGVPNCTPASAVSLFSHPPTGTGNHTLLGNAHDHLLPYLPANKTHCTSQVGSTTPSVSNSMLALTSVPVSITPVTSASSTCISLQPLPGVMLAQASPVAFREDSLRSTRPPVDTRTSLLTPLTSDSKHVHFDQLSPAIAVSSHLASVTASQLQSATILGNSVSFESSLIPSLSYSTVHTALTPSIGYASAHLASNPTIGYSTSSAMHSILTPSLDYPTRGTILTPSMGYPTSGAICPVNPTPLVAYSTSTSLPVHVPLGSTRAVPPRDSPSSMQSELLDTSASQLDWSSLTDSAPSPPPLSVALQVPHFSLPALTSASSGTDSMPTTFAHASQSPKLSQSAVSVSSLSWIADSRRRLGKGTDDVSTSFSQHGVGAGTYTMCRAPSITLKIPPDLTSQTRPNFPPFSSTSTAKNDHLPSSSACLPSSSTTTTSSLPSLSDVHTSLERMSTLAKSVLHEISQEQQVLAATHPTHIKETRTDSSNTRQGTASNPSFVNETEHQSDTSNTLLPLPTDMSASMPRFGPAQRNMSTDLLHLDSPTPTSTPADYPHLELPTQTVGTIPRHLKPPALSSQSQHTVAAAPILNEDDRMNSGGVSLLSRMPQGSRTGTGWFALSSHVAH